MSRTPPVDPFLIFNWPVTKYSRPRIILFIVKFWLQIMQIWWVDIIAHYRVSVVLQTQSLLTSALSLLSFYHHFYFPTLTQRRRNWMYETYATVSDIQITFKPDWPNKPPRKTCFSMWSQLTLARPLTCPSLKIKIRLIQGWFWVAVNRFFSKFSFTHIMAENCNQHKYLKSEKSLS